MRKVNVGCALMVLAAAARAWRLSVGSTNSLGGRIHTSASSDTLSNAQRLEGFALRRQLFGAAGLVSAVLLLRPPIAAAAGSARKSANEAQFEMFKRGLDLTHTFRFEEADAVYSDIINLFADPATLPDRDKVVVARAFSNRGNSRAMLERNSEALLDYSRAIDLSPDVSEYWLNRGLAYEVVGDNLLLETPNAAFQFYEAAVQDYDHAIVLSPEDHRVMINAGDVLTHLGRYADALENYRRALAIFSSPAIRAKVALTEIQVGNVDRGCYIVHSIVRRNSDYAEMLLAESALNWTFGRFAEGIDTYAAALDRDPRLQSQEYLRMQLHWPPTMLNMVTQLRNAGEMQGTRTRAVSWFDYGVSI